MTNRNAATANFIDELEAEFLGHMAAGRTDAANNCQREAVLASSAAYCPTWAIRAIAEIGATERDLVIIRQDYEAASFLYRSAAATSGRVLGSISDDLAFAKARARAAGLI